MASLPTWDRGLKLFKIHVINVRCTVAPYVGAWIETLKSGIASGLGDVAPYVGAWIETKMTPWQTRRGITSLPTWERGLKPSFCCASPVFSVSLPTWERGLKPLYQQHYERIRHRRSLRGSVD